MNDTDGYEEELRKRQKVNAVVCKVGFGVLVLLAVVLELMAAWFEYSHWDH